MAFFDVKMLGDIMQRIHDPERIKDLLIITPLNVLFASFHLFTFDAVLCWYRW